MKIQRRMGICIAVIVVVGLWIWRYTSLNDYYDGISTVVEKVYTAGEIVPFEKDCVDSGTLNGYSIRVDSFEIQELEDVCKAYGVTQYDLLSKPDRVALVTVTLFNTDNVAEAVTLQDFQLHGIDSLVGMNWGLLNILNPVLKGNYAIRLEEGVQYQFVLPYNLRQRSFKNSTWNDLNGYKWFLRVTTWPTEKDIAIN